MQDNVTATECRGWLMRIHTCVKEKRRIFWAQDMTFQFISDTQNILVDVCLC